jgi:CPA2 family monovalent cation:H+ antiporter-2
VNPFVLVLGVGAPPLVEELAITVAAAALFGYIAQRIGLVSIVGYLLAGVVIGPFALGLIDDLELVEQMGEIGVIFLMFFIGLELSGDMLKKMGALMMGGGALQVGLTIALVTAVSLGFGVDVKTGIYTGCLVALSSTAVVLKLLSKRNETASPTGEVAIAFLIFQDIAVVILVLLVPMLGDGGGGLGDVVWATARAFIVIAMVIAVAKWVIPAVLDRVTKYTDNEEFMLATIAIAGGVGYAVTLFGLTASLGAFVAGLVVAAGVHRERATENIMPFQVLFAAIFFTSIGMLLDPAAFVDLWPVILFMCLAAVVVKVIATGAAAAVFKRPFPVVVSSAFVLAQIGEFSFILEKIGRDAGLTPSGRGEDGSQIFIAATVILIALTPLLFSIGKGLQHRLENPSATDPELSAAA